MDECKLWLRTGRPARFGWSLQPRSTSEGSAISQLAILTLSIDGVHSGANSTHGHPQCSPPNSEPAGDGSVKICTDTERQRLLSDSCHTAPGDRVRVISSPFGASAPDFFTDSVTDGIVSRVVLQVEVLSHPFNLCRACQAVQWCLILPCLEIGSSSQ